MLRAIVHSPATTANLGPGFDTLGLALDLWNTTQFTFEGREVQVRVKGEGRDSLPTDQENLIYRAFSRIYSATTSTQPQGILIECENHIPLCSGLGSSAAAILAGLVGANTLLGKPLDSRQILRIASDFEGHCDNIVAALYGGLTIGIEDEDGLYAYPVDCGIAQAVVVLPEFSITTRESRAVIPELFSRKDVVYNLGRTALVVEALRSGNYDALMRATRDQLHQPYRLKVIPGAAQAIQAAQELDAPAVLSGAGPAVIAFPRRATEDVLEVMVKAYEKNGVKARGWILNISPKGVTSDSE